MRGPGDAREMPGGTGPDDVRLALAALAVRLAGRGPALAPRSPWSGHRSAAATHDLAASPPAEPARPSPPGRRAVQAPEDAAVVLATSGSTGAPRLVALSAEAIVASARAVHDRLGGPGRWLLALGIDHVAGLQVLARSVVAGTEPAVLDTSAGFDPARLAAAIASLGRTSRRYAALVPTQLVRALRDPAATAALASLDAVLVGGAALPAAPRAVALSAGIPVVATYGMTETGGGCVYDGIPLRGVGVEADAGGRLLVAGPTLALGYLDDDGAILDASPGAPDDAARFLVREGVRWVRTSDLGAIDGEGRVLVSGRADDVIITGGVNVHPGPVERILADQPGIAEAVVVGVPDPEWGARVVAVVVPVRPGPRPDLEEVRRAVTERLGAPHAPRAVAVVGALPLLGSGKVDRIRAASLAAGILAGP